MSSMVRSKGIIFFPSDDLEMEDQFTTHTPTLRDGKIIYSKGNEHIIDALRCIILIREEDNLDPVGKEVVSLKPVLTNPIFIRFMYLRPDTPSLIRHPFVVKGSLRLQAFEDRHEEASYIGDNSRQIANRNVGL